MYKLYARYALSLNRQWNFVDKAHSIEGIMELMKHPDVELLDDTLLAVWDELELLAFGMVNNRQGFLAIGLPSVSRFRRGKERKFFHSYGYDWDGAWDQCEEAASLLHLAVITQTSHRLIVKAACACARFALATPSIVASGISVGMGHQVLEAAESWAKNNASREDVLRLVSRLADRGDFHYGVVAARWAGASVYKPSQAHLAGEYAQEHIRRSTGFAGATPELIAAIKSNITLADVLRNIVVPIELK